MTKANETVVVVVPGFYFWLNCCEKSCVGIVLATRRQIWPDFIFHGFPRALEVIEPISERLVNDICDFIQHVRTASFA